MASSSASGGAPKASNVSSPLQQLDNDDQAPLLLTKCWTFSSDNDKFYSTCVSALVILELLSGI